MSHELFTAMSQVQTDLRMLMQRVQEHAAAVEALAARVTALEAAVVAEKKRGPGRPRKAEVS